jgi:hypothetical protein
MKQHDLLHAYSEWLDSEGLVKAETVEDSRSHDDLVTEFLADRRQRQREGRT